MSQIDIINRTTPRLYFEDGNIWANKSFKAFDITLKGNYDIISNNIENLLIIADGNRLIGTCLGDSSIIQETPFLKFKGNPKFFKGRILDAENRVRPLVYKQLHCDLFNRIKSEPRYITMKYEDLNRGDLKIPFRKKRKPSIARSDKWATKNLHTDGGEFYLANGSSYKGYYFIDRNFNIYAGESTSDRSKKLSFHRGNASRKLKTKKRIIYKNSMGGY